MSETGAVILAAGMSSRMGDFKPMLRLGDKTIIARVAELMQGSGASPVVIVTGNRSEVIEHHLEGTGVLFAQNELYETTQMLDSLLIGLKKLPSECRRVLISPCDIPLVSPETIRLLKGTAGAFVRPSFEGKAGHPALMDCSLVPMLEGYTGSGGLRGAIEAAGIAPTDVEVSDRGVLLDADTPDDYIALLGYFAEISGM